MKKILFVTDTYYPDSSATTTLSRRTAEALAALGYSVDVYPAEITGNHFAYPEEYNGVTICRDAACHVSNNNAPVKASEDHPITQEQIDRLTQILHNNDYDCVFSVAIAFEVNFLVHEVLCKDGARSVSPKMCEDGACSVSTGKSIRWFPMAYDPYAFDPHVTPEQRKVRVERENNALKDATRIFFLTEFKEDYIGSPIENKIEWFMLPCIRPINPDRTKKAITFDHTYINCVFLGDFYYGVENTDFIFRLFEALSNEGDALPFVSTRIRLYTVGNLCDFTPTVERWKEKLGERYICHERVSQEEAHNIMLDCDVLVSMGHDSLNMCPSKIIDFISSGKPILHIKKIPDCCGAKYLQQYPDKCCIYQGDELTQERVNEVREFICRDALPCVSQGIPFDKVKTLYKDFTMEALIEKILKEIQ